MDSAQSTINMCNMLARPRGGLGARPKEFEVLKKAYPGGSATQQNRVRDYVIFEDYTGITPGLHQACTRITHICKSLNY